MKCGVSLAKKIINDGYGMRSIMKQVLSPYVPIRLETVLFLNWTLFCMSIFVGCVSNAKEHNSKKEAYHTKLSKIHKKLMILEEQSGGRLGLSALNLSNSKQILYRENERFPLCSTAKTIVCAQVLQKNMSDSSFLKKHLNFDENLLSSSGYAPITVKYLNFGMTIEELCDAALKYSDNAAMNLLMKELGGPTAVNDSINSNGQYIFQINRWEPELNSALPGDKRDTVTPKSMMFLLKNYLFSNVLGASEQNQLLTWMIENTTGDNRIRSGVPKGWKVADKTGTGSYGTTNDIGVLFPPHHKPIIVAIYFTQNDKNAKPRDDIIASTTHIIVDAIK